MVPESIGLCFNQGMGLWFWVWGLGFGVWGLGFRVLVPTRLSVSVMLISTAVVV